MPANHAYSQEFIKPNYGLKSHETLVISKVELSATEATFYMSVENRIPGGTFCANKKIFILYPDGERSKLVRSEGIPVCPDTHSFSSIGEKLDFTLTFPPLKPGTEWIDLIEDCSENCFSFYGVTLDNELNRNIDDAFSLAEKGESVNAMNSFIELAETTEKKNLGIEGLLYVNIIRLARESGNQTKAAQWYARLKESRLPRLEQYIKYLNDQRISY